MAAAERTEEDQMPCEGNRNMLLLARGFARVEGINR